MQCELILNLIHVSLNYHIQTVYDLDLQVETYRKLKETMTANADATIEFHLQLRRVFDEGMGIEVRPNSLSYNH